MIRRSVKDMRHAEFTSLLLDQIQQITNQTKLFISAASGVVWRQELFHDPFWTPLSHYVALDSPSYTDDSKLMGPERIHPFFPSHCSLSVSGVVSMVYRHQHHRRLEPSKGRPLRLRSLAARCSGGPREAVRVLGAGGESWSSIKLSGLPSASPSGRLPQLEPGDIVSRRSSLAKPTTVS